MARLARSDDAGVEKAKLSQRPNYGERQKIGAPSILRPGKRGFNAFAESFFPVTLRPLKISKNSFSPAKPSVGVRLRRK